MRLPISKRERFSWFCSRLLTNTHHWPTGTWLHPNMCEFHETILTFMKATCSLQLATIETCKWSQMSLMTLVTILLEPSASITRVAKSIDLLLFIECWCPANRFFNKMLKNMHNVEYFRMTVVKRPEVKYTKLFINNQWVDAVEGRWVFFNQYFSYLTYMVQCTIGAHKVTHLNLLVHI